MAIDTSIPRTRRALLAGGVGGMAAVVASALGRPLPADAATGNFDSAVSGTPAVKAQNTAATGGPAYGLYGLSASTGGTAVLGYASAVSGITNGVYGYVSSRRGTAVLGYASAATGVTYGVYSVSSSTDGTGVWGQAAAASGATRGVYGRAESPDGTAVYGASPSSGVGVRGTSATGDGVVGSSGGANKSGVYGFTDVLGGFGVFGRNKWSGATGALGVGTVGVQGASPAAAGVVGVSGGASAPASAETGVHGYAIQSASARGVHGQTTIGTGVYATATTGYALRTSGRVRVDKASGMATIAAAKTSVTVTPGLDVTSSSFVLLTPKGDLGTRRLWYTTDATNNRFTIRVSSAVTADLKVGWLLLG